MQSILVIALLAAPVISAMGLATASAYVSSAVEAASLVSPASATSLAFNPQPDPPGRQDEDDRFDFG